MTLTTTAFTDGGTIPIQFTQAGPGVAQGEGTSPALTWANAPAGTQSFVLHMHDMEVVRMRGLEDQVHWLVWNIPANVTSLPEGVPRGATLSNGAFQISATGPVSPAGKCSCMARVLRPLTESCGSSVRRPYVVQS